MADNLIKIIDNIAKKEITSGSAGLKYKKKVLLTLTY